MNSVLRRVLLSGDSHPSLILRLRCYSTPTRTRKSKTPPWPKPSEIPFQPKLANAVNLTGKVDAPVQFQTSPDGNTWAATVITRQDHSSLWYPSIVISLFPLIINNSQKCVVTTVSDIE